MEPSRQDNIGTRPAPHNGLLRFFPSLTDAAFIVPLVFIFLYLPGGAHLLADGNTGWHLRTGEWIIQNGRVPDKDIFSYTMSGRQWFAWEWLWDVLFGWLHMNLGMAAVLGVSLLVICLTYALLFRSTRRNCSNVFVAFALTVLAAAGSTMHWLARPHLFTLLLVAVFSAILARVQEGRTRLLWWLLPLTVLWTNLHGAFFVGVMMIACYGGAELLSWLLERDRSAATEALLRSRTYLAAAAGCAALSLLNPYGWRLHMHIWDYLGTPWIFQNVIEFRGTNFQSPQASYFEPMVILGVLALGWSLSRRRYADALILLPWVHLSLFSVRNVPVFLVLATPVIARMLQEQLDYLETASLAGWVTQTARRFRERASEFGATDRLARLHLASALALLGVYGALSLPSPPSKFRPEYDGKLYPVAAAKLLHQPEFSSSVFTTDAWGDYLIFSLYPDIKVFVDGRSDFYGQAFNEKYVSLLAAKNGWEATLKSHGVDTVLLPAEAPLAGALRESMRWRKAYDDGHAIVYHSVAATTQARLTTEEQVSASAELPQSRETRGRETTRLKNGDPSIAKSKTGSESI
jgi:hypothetical protein